MRLECVCVCVVRKMHIWSAHSLECGWGEVGVKWGEVCVTKQKYRTVYDSAYHILLESLNDAMK